MGDQANESKFLAKASPSRADPLETSRHSFQHQYTYPPSHLHQSLVMKLLSRIANDTEFILDIVNNNVLFVVVTDRLVHSSWQFLVCSSGKEYDILSSRRRRHNAGIIVQRPNPHQHLTEKR